MKKTKKNNSEENLESGGLKFVAKHSKPFKFYLILHFFVIIYLAIDASLWPYVSKLLIDKLATSSPENVIDEGTIEKYNIVIKDLFSLRVIDETAISYDIFLPVNQFTRLSTGF